EDLAARALGAIWATFGGLLRRLLVGHRAPRPGGYGVLLDLLQGAGDAGLAEIFLGDDVGRHLAPGSGDVDILELEHHRAVRVSNLAGGRTEVDAGKGTLVGFGVAAFDAHSNSPQMRRTPLPAGRDLRLLPLFLTLTNLNPVLPPDRGIVPLPRTLPDCCRFPVSRTCRTDRPFRRNPKNLAWFSESVNAIGKGVTDKP